jgi:Flp pilus assembly pilin Flp
MKIVGRAEFETRRFGLRPPSSFAASLLGRAMMRFIRKHGDAGAVSTEYALMVIALAMVIAFSAQLVGSNLLSIYMVIVAAV